MSDSRYRVGDRVRHVRAGYVGIVVEVRPCGGGSQYVVRYDCIDNDEYFLREAEIEFVDPRGVFLSRLKELLEEFDAEIVAHIGEDDATHMDKPMVYIQIGSDVVNYEGGIDRCELTPEW